MTVIASPQIKKPVSAATAPRQTKAALMRVRLAEPGGASMTELMLLTGWQAHTLRAVVTGLRKTGLSITRHSEGAETIYSISSADPVLARDDGVQQGAEAAAASPSIEANVPAAPTSTPDGDAVIMIVDSSQGAA